MPGKILTRLSVIILGLIIILPSCSAPGAAVTPVEEDTRTSLPAAKQVEPTSTSPGIENSLKLFAPLPGEEITGTVTVHGEGRAFENTILAEVRAGGATLGRNIVTTTADIGQVAEFTTTIRFEPVTVETEGVVIIYTESAKDGSIDQSASVRVRLLPGDAQPTRAGGQPFIKITPPSGNGGTSVLVQGTGFPDGEVVEIRIGGLNTSATSEAYANVTAGKGG